MNIAALVGDIYRHTKKNGEKVSDSEFLLEGVRVQSVDDGWTHVVQTEDLLVYRTGDFPLVFKLGDETLLVKVAEEFELTNPNT